MHFDNMINIAQCIIRNPDPGGVNFRILEEVQLPSQFWGENTFIHHNYALSVLDKYHKTKNFQCKFIV